jgi:hypothetical protein
VDYRGTPLSFNTDVQNPKALNADLPDDVDLSTGFDGTNVFTRAPQVGLFRIWKDGTKSGASIDLYAISNHFSSTPNARVGQRRKHLQCRHLAARRLPMLMKWRWAGFNVYPAGRSPPPAALSFRPARPLYDPGPEQPV